MYVSILYCYNIYVFDNNNIESYTVFLTNSCLVLVLSAVRFCPHDLILYGAHMGAQRQTVPRQTVPPPALTFSIQIFQYCYYQRHKRYNNTV